MGNARWHLDGFWKGSVLCSICTTLPSHCRGLWVKGSELNPSPRNHMSKGRELLHQILQVENILCPPVKA